MITIKVYDSLMQDTSDFYSIMGRYFASLDIKKELESQLYNKVGSIWYLIYNDYELVGFCALYPTKDNYMYLDNLYVFPQYRGNGYATELISNIIKCHNKIHLIACNDYAIKIYKSLGFIEFGNNGKWKKFKNFL